MYTYNLNVSNDGYKQFEFEEVFNVGGTLYEKSLKLFLGEECFSKGSTSKKCIASKSFFDIIKCMAQDDRTDCAKLINFDLFGNIGLSFIRFYCDNRRYIDISESHYLTDNEPEYEGHAIILDLDNLFINSNYGVCAGLITNVTGGSIGRPIQ